MSQVLKQKSSLRVEIAQNGLQQLLSSTLGCSSGFGKQKSVASWQGKALRYVFMVACMCTNRCWHCGDDEEDAEGGGQEDKREYLVRTC